MEMESRSDTKQKSASRKSSDGSRSVNGSSIKNKERFHNKLSDVGLYCMGGLCAVSLSQLFYEECQRDYKKKALEKILHDLGQPKQTNESMFALLDGEIMEDSHAFVDSLMGEACLKEGKHPLIADLIALAISDGCYDARMRVLIKHVAWQLRVTWDEVESIEEELAETLEYETYVMSEEEMKEKAKKTRNRKVKRYALIGLATVGGGALIGLTGGLAAPLVAAGAGAVIGGAGAAALGSAAGVAVIGSLFGVAGAGLTGYKMKRRVGAVDEFSFEPLTLMGSKLDSNRTIKQLHITIAVTGWINDKTQDFRIPWSALAESKEQYSLRWESKYLNQLGEALDYLVQTGISVATTEALKYTILSGLITAIAWPAALIGAAGAIDNPWHVCTQRATEAGKQLAEVLLGREQGNRPVTLIGFSLGSRVIFSCLEELAKRTGGEGLVEDVIFLGAPVSGDPKHWQRLTKVVAGKIVNGYARGDWLLKFLYRTASVTIRVAGLSPVKWDNRRMHNIDLSDIIDGHGDYIKYLDTILKAVGVRTKDELKVSPNKPWKTGHNQREGHNQNVDSERERESDNGRKTDDDCERETDNGIENKDLKVKCDNGKQESNESKADNSDTWVEERTDEVGSVAGQDKDNETKEISKENNLQSGRQNDTEHNDGVVEIKSGMKNNTHDHDKEGGTCKTKQNKVYDHQPVVNSEENESAIAGKSAILEEKEFKQSDKDTPLDVQEKSVPYTNSCIYEKNVEDSEACYFTDSNPESDSD